MNILLVNHNAGSPKHGMEFVSYYMAREWVKHGHKVTIVAASYSHLRHHNIDTPFPFKETIDNIDYLWLPVSSFDKNDEKRIKNMQQFAEQIEKSASFIATLQPNLVIDISRHPLATKACYNIAQKAQAKYIVGLHDMWQVVNMEVADFDAYNKLMQEAERERFLKADKIMSPLPNATEYVASLGIDKKVWYIPDGVVLDDYTSVEALEPNFAQTIAAYKAQGKFLVGYAGKLDKEKALDSFIEAVSKVPNLPLQVILLGDGYEEAHLRQLIDKLKLTNVLIHAPVPKSMVRAFLKEMDCLYAGWSNNEMYRYGISYNKVLEYMFAPKPIIHSVSAENDVVQQAKCGLTVPAEDVDAIAEALKQMVNLSPEERAAMATKGRDYVTRQLNYRTLAEWFLEVCRIF